MGIGLAGVILTAVSFVISPTVTVLAFFFLHLFLFSVVYKMSRIKIGATVGVVRDAQTSAPVANTVIRLVDAQYEKVCQTEHTDTQGRYAMLVGPSQYYVTFEKGGYREKRTDVLDYSSKKTKGVGGVIAQDEELDKQ